MESNVRKKPLDTEEGITFEGYTIPALDKVHFYQHLSLMLGSGISIMQALDIISADQSELVLPRTEDPKEGRHSIRRLFKLQKNAPSAPLFEIPKYIRKRSKAQLALIISRNISKGNSLSHSMARIPEVFDEHEVLTVQMAEKGGRLVETLDRLGQNLEEMRRNTLEMKKALTLPLLIAAFSFLFLITIPSLFGFMIDDGMISSDSGFPVLYAYYMIRASQLLAQPITGLIGLVGLIVLAYLLRNRETQKKAKRLFWRVASVLPGIRRYRQAVLAQHFIVSFNMLNDSGFVADKAISCALDSCGDPDYAHKKHEAVERLKNGEKLYQALDFLPHLATIAIEAGEESGELSKSLNSVATLLQDNLRHTREVALNLLEPAMLIFTGVLVALLAVSVLSAVSSMVTF